MMRAIDTSLLYALFNDADDHHQAALKAFRDPEPIGVPAGIWQETLDIIRFRRGKKQAIEAAEFLLSLPHVRVLAAPGREATDELWRRHDALSQADAGALVTALREQADLLTKDVKQRAAFEKTRR